MSSGDVQESPQALPSEARDDILRAAVLAPTPDNNQPWQFAWQENRLLVFLDPGRALPSDVHSMFDLMGIGAAVENAGIAARWHGHRGEVTCELPSAAEASSAGPRLAASVRFEPGAERDPLRDALETRCTNRKLYSSKPLEEEVLAELARSVAGFGSVQLEWIADRKGIRAFAKVVAASDRFRFGYEPFHKEIFRQLRFSAREAEQTRDGLDVRTLELPPSAALMLRVLRPWNRMRWLQRLGLGGLLTIPSRLSVWKSGAVGVLSVAEAEAAQYLEGGRALERIWLAAQRNGIALQPLGSLAIFLAQLLQLDGRNLTPSHQALAARLAQRLTELVPSMEGRTLLMLFRLGRAADPRVRSLRRPVEHVIRQA